MRASPTPLASQLTLSCPRLLAPAALGDERIVPFRTSYGVDFKAPFQGTEQLRSPNRNEDLVKVRVAAGGAVRGRGRALGWGRRVWACHGGRRHISAAPDMLVEQVGCGNMDALHGTCTRPHLVNHMLAVPWPQTTSSLTNIYRSSFNRVGE
jgi:hypothetical protein